VLGNSKLKLGTELLEYIESKKSKKGQDEDQSKLDLQSIKDDDSKH